MKPKTYATATSFRRALEDRLSTVTKAEGVDLQRIRRHVAFDRLLSRLFAGQNAPWVLKGGYALELKLATARTTKDIDLGLDQLPGLGGEPPSSSRHRTYSSIAATSGTEMFSSSDVAAM